VIGFRTPVRGRNFLFYARVQTGLGDNPASRTGGTEILSCGLRRPGSGVDHPPNLAWKLEIGRVVHQPPPPLIAACFVMGRPLPLPEDVDVRAHKTEVTAETREIHGEELHNV